IVGGVVQGAIATFVDITERKLAEAQIHNLAFYDALTQLPNRRLLYDRLDHAIAASKRSSCYGALMFMDLDNFKLLNDTHGHKMGDLLLIEVARRIESCIRETDTVARFGGDEFVVLLGDLDEDATESERQALAIAERIRAGLSEPYYLAISQEADSLLEHRCSSSIGVVMFHHSVNREALLKSTDEAMYKAKEMGRNCVVVEQYAGPVGAEQKATILRLEWHDSYGCGEPTIDEEHRKLFDLANALIRSAFTRDEEPKQFDEDLERLLTHIVQHFSDEEAILESHHYPDLAAHRHAHQILVRKAKQLMKTAESGGISIGKLVNFLANEVIAQHMLKMDCKFYSLFEKNLISQAD
ncbi:MAG: bacteriohemerythrin, partial [Gallionellaceae bacterium]|nr:bacteriohemerythrin [Gallionellaceae bacterium]